jgi:GDP-D-mannose dehydratase
MKLELGETNMKRSFGIDISFAFAAKAKSVLGWKARVQLPEIIARMVEEELRFVEISPVRL